MLLPTAVKATVKERLWRSADDLGWSNFDVHQRTKQYGFWMQDPRIGGVLENYMLPAKARAYLKDTLMKQYARARMSDVTLVFSALEIPPTNSVEKQERPHGLVIPHKGVVCWGKADDWKLVLMAVHERAHLRREAPFAAVLLPPLKRFPDEASRAVVVSAAEKLGIRRLAWVEKPSRLSWSLS